MGSRCLRLKGIPEVPRTPALAPPVTSTGRVGEMVILSFDVLKDKFLLGSSVPAFTVTGQGGDVSALTTEQ